MADVLIEQLPQITGSLQPTDVFPFDRVTGTHTSYKVMLSQIAAYITGGGSVQALIAAAVAAEAQLRQNADNAEIQARQAADAAEKARAQGVENNLQGQINQNTAAIDYLEARTMRYAVTFPNSNPSQAQIQTAYETASKKSGTAPDNTRLVDVAKNITYTWFASENQWVYTGADTLPAFTNDVGGYLLGKTPVDQSFDGQDAGTVTSIDSLGHGAVNGWAALITKIAAIVQAISDEEFARKQADLNEAAARDEADQGIIEMIGDLVDNVIAGIEADLALKANRDSDTLEGIPQTPTPDGTVPGQITNVEYVLEKFNYLAEQIDSSLPISFVALDGSFLKTLNGVQYVMRE